MFNVRGNLERGGATIRIGAALDRRVYLASTEHRGTVYDSSFVPRTANGPNKAMLFLVLQGAIEWHPPRPMKGEGPVAFALGTDDFDSRRTGPRQSFRLSGDCVRGIEVRLVTPATVSQVERVELPEAAWAAARRYTAALWDHDGSGAPSSGAEAVALVRALQDAGVVAGDVAGTMDSTVDEPLSDLLNAIGDHYGRLDVQPSLKTMANAMNVSLRSLSRLMMTLWKHYPALPGAWRELMLDARIKVAVHLLSVEALSVRDVAVAVGYRHREAMANAFKNADLPAPREVRASLLEAAVEPE